MSGHTSTIQNENLGLGKGLYAIFETTLGKMVCRLEEEKTPETVKNFTGLATGEKEYTDPKTGQKSQAYFTGSLKTLWFRVEIVSAKEPAGRDIASPMNFTLR
jgi:hypothetical protein